MVVGLGYAMTPEEMIERDNEVHKPTIYPRAGHGPRMFYHDWVIRCACGFGARVSFYDTAEAVAGAHVTGEEPGTDPIDADDQWISHDDP